MTPSVSYKQLPPSLKVSVLDAIFFTIMFGVGESYLGAYGVYLGLAPLQIGLLTTLPLFVGALSQLLGVRLMEAHIRRRRLILAGAICQAHTWLIVLSIPWFISSPELAGWLLICTVCAYSVAGQIIVPSWTSLIGDVVPTESRGNFFGMRNKISGYFLLASFLLAGYVLQLAEQSHRELFAFSALFVVAYLARIGSSYFLKRHEDPDFIFTMDDAFSFWAFLRKLPRSNFAKFALFHGAFNFAMFVAGPYFVLYVLRELQFSYWEYTLISSVWIGTNFLMMQFWGRFGDTFGNKTIFNICCIGLVFIPLLWTVSDSLLYLMGLQFIAGIFTAGFQLAAINFLFDCVTPGKRGRCIAYLSVLNATFVISGSLLGSFLIESLQSGVLAAIRPSNSAFIPLFFISAGLRATISIALLGKFQEVRAVPSFDYRKPFYRIARIQPFTSAGLGIAVGIYRNRLKMGSSTPSGTASTETGQAETPQPPVSE
jgi:MFS family permease